MAFISKRKIRDFKNGKKVVVVTNQRRRQREDVIRRAQITEMVERLQIKFGPLIEHNDDAYFAIQRIQSVSEYIDKNKPSNPQQQIQVVLPQQLQLQYQLTQQLIQLEQQERERLAKQQYADDNEVYEGDEEYEEYEEEYEVEEGEEEEDQYDVVQEVVEKEQQQQQEEVVEQPILKTINIEKFKFPILYNNNNNLNSLNNLNSNYDDNDNTFKNLQLPSLKSFLSSEDYQNRSELPVLPSFDFPILNLNN